MNTFPLAIQNNPNKGTYFNVCFATQTVRFGNSKFEKKIIWKWVKTTKQMEFWHKNKLLFPKKDKSNNDWWLET